MTTNSHWIIGIVAGGGLVALSGCIPIPIGHEIVQKRLVIPCGATEIIVVDCPAGKKVLGGGFSTETPDDIKLYSSNPSDGKGNLSNTKWSVMVKNIGTHERQTTAIAVCANVQ